MLAALADEDRARSPECCAHEILRLAAAVHQTPQYVRYTILIEHTSLPLPLPVSNGSF